ncbi:MAG: hypothetical protein ABIH34_05840, partial [Nanoarchaeota archaeon]
MRPIILILALLILLPVVMADYPDVDIFVSDYYPDVGETITLTVAVSSGWDFQPLSRFDMFIDGQYSESKDCWN